MNSIQFLNPAKTSPTEWILFLVKGFSQDYIIYIYIKKQPKNNNY